MISIIPAIKQAIAVIALFITLAEDASGSGSGAEKKAKVISDVKAQLPALATSLGVPGVAVSLMVNEAILTVVIDLLVAAANASGAFAKGPEAAPMDPTPAAQ